MCLRPTHSMTVLVDAVVTCEFHRPAVESLGSADRGPRLLDHVSALADGGAGFPIAICARGDLDSSCGEQSADRLDPETRARMSPINWTVSGGEGLFPRQENRC